MSEHEQQHQTPTPDPGAPSGTTENKPGVTPPQTPPAAPLPLHEHPEFKDRMDQAKRSGQRDLLAALGFTGVETPDGLAQAQQDLAGLVEFARQQREAALTAEQKLAEQIAALTSARDTLSAERDQFKQAAEQAQQQLAEQQADQVRVSALEAAATAAGAARPADVVMWARSSRAGDYGAVIGEDQAVNAGQVQALITACAEARPEWFAARTPGSPSHAGAKAPVAPATEQAKRELARSVVQRGMR